MPEMEHGSSSRLPGDKNHCGARCHDVMVGGAEADGVFFLDDVVRGRKMGVHEAMPPARRQVEALPVPVSIEDDVEIGLPVTAVELEGQDALLARPVRAADLVAVPANAID